MMILRTVSILGEQKGDTRVICIITHQRKPTFFFSFFFFFCEMVPNKSQDLASREGVNNVISYKLIC
jgi:hypothetical protein